MKRKSLTMAAAAAAILLAGATYAGSTLAHGPGGGSGGGSGYGMMGQGPGYGMMGQGRGYGMMGQGRGYGMMGQGPGYGMMGQGPGYGMMGQGPGFGMMGYGPGGFGDCPLGQAAGGQDLTVDGVTAFLERRLAMAGNDRLKLGAVSEPDDDTIVAEIVTQDGSLVEKLAFDRHTGRAKRAE